MESDSVGKLEKRLPIHWRSAGWDRRHNHSHFTANRTMTQTPQIALIGTEGSGKTVLTTVLAKKLSQATTGGLCMIPISAKTAKYIESAWATLQSGEWVPSTPAGQLFDLHWKLQIGNQQAEMKLIDSAGQDLRKLFSGEAYQDPNLPEQDKLFIDYIRSSSILIILINLRDFIAETNSERKIENQTSLKEALEFINKDSNKHVAVVRRKHWSGIVALKMLLKLPALVVRRKRCFGTVVHINNDCNKQVAVVLPQYDEYRAIIQQRYGSDKAFIQQELPHLYNSQASNWKENLFPVAAVNDTEIRYDKDGRTRKVPKPDFSSNGLDPLIKWLDGALQNDLFAATMLPNAGTHSKTKNCPKLSKAATMLPNAGTHSGCGCLILIIAFIGVLATLYKTIC
jgi:GTPase SAR1 family protein